MKWERARISGYVGDRPGRRLAAGGGLGIGGIAIVVVVSMLLGKNPLEMTGLISETQMAVNGSPSTTSPGPADEANQFVASILGETEDAWIELFETGSAAYPAPTLVLFTGLVRSACASAIGDDRFQRESSGVGVPDAFTHGTARQRVRWFRIGFEHGEPKRRDTFEASAL